MRKHLPPEQELDRFYDGELDPAAQRRVEERLAADGQARREVEDLSEIGRALQSTTRELTERVPVEPSRLAKAAMAAEGGAIPFPAMVRWGLAAAAGAAILAGGWWYAGDAGSAAPRARAAEVEYVETHLPGASSVVYRDEETDTTVIWVMAPEAGGDGVDS